MPARLVTTRGFTLLLFCSAVETPSSSWNVTKTVLYTFGANQVAWDGDRPGEEELLKCRRYCLRHPGNTYSGCMVSWDAPTGTTRQLHCALVTNELLAHGNKKASGGGGAVCFHKVNPLYFDRQQQHRAVHHRGSLQSVCHLFHCAPVDYSVLNIPPLTTRIPTLLGFSFFLK